MAAKKTSKKRVKDLLPDPPILVGGGGSFRVFFKNTATEIVPSPKAGYRCFRLGSNLKKLAIFDGDIGLIDVDLKGPSYFVQFEE
jgi:hypothetical protein